MADIVDAATRRRMMAGIRARNTTPELLLRKALFERGFRYRLHAEGLPGRPDLVFPRYRAVIFVHGCFWHMHGCDSFRMPASRQAFWQQKLEANRRRDRRQIAALRETGWRVLVVWECAFKRAGEERLDTVADMVAGWLVGGAGRSVCASLAIVNGQPAISVEEDGIGDEAG